MYLTDIEISRPLSPLTLPERSRGVALIVRRNTRPIGFLMREDLSGPVVSKEDIEEWIAKELGEKLVSESLREQLLTPRRIDPFPELTVVICTHDRTPLLARCLRSIQPLQAAYGFEVLVIDNAPSDTGTRALLGEFPAMGYVLERTPGLNFARNRALHAATGRLIAYLDDDVVVDRGWYEGLREAWQENPDAAGFTGLVLPLKLDTPARELFEMHGGFRRGFEKIHFGRELTKIRLYPCGSGIIGAGCNMVFRRDVLLALGEFDEALDTGAPLPGGGDLDIFYRVIRAGHSMAYEPSLLVFHEHRETEDSLSRQYHSWGLGIMAFICKSWQSDPSFRSRLLRLITWWFGYQSYQLVRACIGKHVLPASMVWAEIRGGIEGLMGTYERSVRRSRALRKQYGES